MEQSPQTPHRSCILFSVMTTCRWSNRWRAETPTFTTASFSSACLTSTPPHKNRSTPEFTLVHLTGITRGYLLNKMTEAPSSSKIIGLFTEATSQMTTVLFTFHMQVDSDSSTDPFSYSKISSLHPLATALINLQRLLLLLQWTVTLLWTWSIFPGLKLYFFLCLLASWGLRERNGPYDGNLTPVVCYFFFYPVSFSTLHVPRFENCP